MAAPSVLRQQKQDDLDRAQRAADAIAGEDEGLKEKAEALKNASGRDDLHKETYRLTALADFLEAVAVAFGAELDGHELEDVDGVSGDVAEELRALGYETPDDLADASDEELLNIDGIGPSTLKKIRADL